MQFDRHGQSTHYPALMKLPFITAMLIGAVALPVFAAEGLKDEKEKTSYAIGTDIGRNVKRSGIELDPAVLARGLNDALTGAKLALTDEELQQVFQKLQTDMQAKQQASQSAAGAKNKTTGDAYLAANKAKEGVKTTASGLQYKIVTEGKGQKPKATDSVVTHYRGTLTSGTEFDSSYRRGEPATFGVTGVIKGWTEALLMMPVGSKWQLTIPSELAYGENGPPSIGPNQTLLFDIELLSIKAPEGAPAAK